MKRLGGKREGYMTEKWLAIVCSVTACWIMAKLTKALLLCSSNSCLSQMAWPWVLNWNESTFPASGLWLFVQLNDQIRDALTIFHQSVGSFILYLPQRQQTLLHHWESSASDMTALRCLSWSSLEMINQRMCEHHRKSSPWFIPHGLLINEWQEYR